MKHKTAACPRIQFWVITSILASCWCVSAGHTQQPDNMLWQAGSAKVADKATPLSPDQVRLGGLLGNRYSASHARRLLRVDDNEMLEGFENRPGSQAWIGEHVGKWMHAASITWAATQDPALRAKLDRVANRLMDAQEPNGYLGTYLPDHRFGLHPGADWDVWVHKYNLLGLLTYYQYTRDQRALRCCQRMADLLIQTFGPDTKSINAAGTMVGMAATSVLEPITLLYRITKDSRYLTFARYIVSAWDQQDCAKLLTDLLAGKPVNRIANAKAYEMLSNLVGMCELYRVTGDTRLLNAVTHAWSDITEHRLYITGSGSSHELWQEDHHLPHDQGANICETCVTVTWMQLNMHLFRLTGDGRYAEQLERTLYNHLLGAQKPTGDDWSYYTALDGLKRYDAVTTCCHSSGPRGVALSPLFLYASAPGRVWVNIYADSQMTVTLPRSGRLTIRQTTEYPLSGRITLTVARTTINTPATLLLRKPIWTPSMTITVNGKEWNAAEASGYRTVTRQWKDGDTVVVQMDMAPRVVMGTHGNTGLGAVLYGPLVLAIDQSLNTEANAPYFNLGLGYDGPSEMTLKREQTPVFSTPGIAYVHDQEPAKSVPLYLTPFYEAGASGSPYRVWIPFRSALKPAPVSLMLGARESRSRQGNAIGSINDTVPSTYVVTFDGTAADEDWYALESDKPVLIDRIQFTQGKLFHDGGWFDTTQSKPRIEVRRTADGDWEPLGVFDGYPSTTAQHPGELKPWQVFELQTTPVSVYAIRLVGRPSRGDNPHQAFSSCGELAAFGPSRQSVSTSVKEH